MSPLCLEVTMKARLLMIAALGLFHAFQGVLLGTGHASGESAPVH